MAHLEIEYLDYIVTAPDASDNSFGVHAPLENINTHSFVIEVVSGSIQFCVGQPVGSNSPVHVAGNKLIMTNVGRRIIYYKANAANDQFIIGF